MLVRLNETCPDKCKITGALNKVDEIASRIGYHRYRTIFLNVLKSLLFHETFHAFTDLNILMVDIFARYYESCDEASLG